MARYRKFKIGATIVLLFGLSSCEFFKTEIEYFPNDYRIVYTGRIDSSDSKNYRFDWSGVSIKTVFSGTSISMKMKDGANDYNIFVDGQLHQILRTTNDSVYIIAEGLTDRKHELLITKRTEAALGVAVFRGFILEKGKSLFKPSFVPSKKIEFIGDSFVAGFGNEGESPECSFSRETENNYLAYGPVLARRFLADYNVIAISGIGVVRNFGDSTYSENPLPNYYTKTLMHDSLDWDFNKWTPDVVIVRLGRNDFWTKPFPKSKDFINAYRKFIELIRTNYPAAEIICLCGPIRKDSHCGYIQSVVNEFALKKKDKKIHFLNMSIPFKRPDDFGCQYNPNVKGHKKIADFLEPHIKRIMKWK